LARMAAPMAPKSPLSARRKLGEELRTLRDQAAMTTQEVGQVLGCHYSKISRIETGKVSCTNRDLESLMTLFGVAGDKRTELRSLMQRGRQRLQPWWHVYSDVISANYSEFLAYEAEAAYCWEFQSIFVPALLQTPAYARAVTSRGLAALGPDQVDTLVEVRRRRQERLREADPILFEAVITEAVLRWHVGGPAAMREQLHHLIAASSQENVRLRVTPFAAGENGANTGAFTLFGPGKGQDAEVAFSEAAEATAEFRDDEIAVRRLSRLFKNLSDAALPEQDSLELIKRIEKELT
jgi:transcriptional regulator with XRE-family HTH domain